MSECSKTVEKDDSLTPLRFFHTNSTLTKGRAVRLGVKKNRIKFATYFVGEGQQMIVNQCDVARETDILRKEELQILFFHQGRIAHICRYSVGGVTGSCRGCKWFNLQMFV